MKILLIFTCLVILSACKKDKIPASKLPPAPTKWEVIPGNYKVYDTLGVFLYDMKLIHSTGSNEYGHQLDSLTFVNFDGNFIFTQLQYQNTQYKFNITISSHSTIYDTIDNRWNIFGYGSNAELNSFRNDSIVLFFEKHNTPYWWNDGTTYYHGIEKQIAVRQH